MKDFELTGPNLYAFLSDYLTGLKFDPRFEVYYIQ